MATPVVMAILVSAASLLFSYVCREKITQTISRLRQK
jgi:hypothetical protein